MYKKFNGQAFKFENLHTKFKVSVLFMYLFILKSDIMTI